MAAVHGYSPCQVNFTSTEVRHGLGTDPLPRRQPPAPRARRGRDLVPRLSRVPLRPRGDAPGRPLGLGGHFRPPPRILLVRIRRGTRPEERRRAAAADPARGPGNGVLHHGSPADDARIDGDLPWGTPAIPPA